MSCFNPFRTRPFQCSLSPYSIYPAGISRAAISERLILKQQAAQLKMEKFTLPSEILRWNGEGCFQRRKLNRANLRCPGKLHRPLWKFKNSLCTWLPNTAFSNHQNKTNSSSLWWIACRKYLKHRSHPEKEQLKYVHMGGNSKLHMTCSRLQQKIPWLELKAHK